jgi:hypothetical protein
MNRMTLHWLLLIFLPVLVQAQKKENTRLVAVDTGWARNSINTVVFRKNSIASSKDTQFIAFYDGHSNVVVGKRKIGSTQWELKKTVFKGNTSDAHNCISIMTDGDGYLHVAWDHHNNPLRYSRSVSPGSLEMSEKMAMTGETEQRVSYPEFFRLANGNLLFFYRDGGSGQGNLVINHYDTRSKKWSRLQNNLIDGQRQRNAYWQAFVDQKGTIHVSWVWRESPDVASNHDMGYARSMDEGRTWTKSTGEKYQLPINQANAEYACRINQGSELINQTSMFADDNGRPYIASYWREQGDSIPQYHLIYKNGNSWRSENLQFRKTPFSLSGTGTKRIPISRPQIIVWKKVVIIIFRDAERGDKVSVAICRNVNKAPLKWEIKDLSTTAVGSWEPSYDTELWKNKTILHLFLQKTEQADGEGRSNLAPQMVNVLEWKVSP